MKALLEATREKLSHYAEGGEFSGVAPVAPTRAPTQTNRGGGRSFKQSVSTLRHPALLEELLGMVTKGLKDLDGQHGGEGHHEADRLAVYRAAFQRYLDESSIYKGFLTGFAHEHDVAIDALRKQVASLSSVRLELPLQMAETSDKARAQAAEHQERTAALLKRISQLEGSLATTERKLKSTETEYREYRENSAKMRSQWEEMRVSCMRLTTSLSRHEEDKKRSKVSDAARQADFVAAKINERKSQEQAERLTVMLQELEAIQATLITKEAVEEQQGLIKHLQQELKAKEALHTDLINRYSILKAAIEASYDQHHAHHTHHTHHAHRGSGGGKHAVVVDGVTLDGRAIRATMERLLNQVATLQASLGLLESQIASEGTVEMLDDADAATEVVFSSPWSHFEGLGMHASVPPYLRAVGRVQNFFMSRRDMARLMREIMGTLQAQERAQEEAAAAALLANPGSKRQEPPPRGPVSSFFEKYLAEKYHSSSKGTEVAYNMMDCLKKYNQESDCRLFAMLLEDLLPPDVWFDLHHTLLTVTEHMKREEARLYGNAAAKRLSIEAFLRALKKVLPNKTDMQIARISRALTLETASNRLVDLERCLGDGDCTWSSVSEELRQQYITEIIDFFDAVTAEVDRARESDQALHAPLADLREALLRADPKKPRAEVNLYLARGCGVSLENMLIMEAKRQDVPLGEFLRRLRGGLLKRS